MAKIAYSKLGLTKQAQIDPINIYCNEQEIEVTQYLPIEKKIDLISNIITNSVDEKSFWNPIRLELFFTIEVVLAYTNLTVTDKQKEDIFKFYDQICASGFATKVMDAIPPDEKELIRTSVTKTIENIYKQKNSAVGILETIASDYSDLRFDVAELQEKMADPENLNLLRNVLEKLG